MAVDANALKLQKLLDTANGYKNQYDSMMKTGFTYDPTKDASYQSLQTLAQNNAKTASKNAMEDMNDRGILNSTITGDRLGQIQQTAQDAVTAQIPQLQQAAYGQYSDKLNQLLGMYNNSLGQYNTDRNYNYQVGRDNRADAEWESAQKYQRAQDALQWNNMSPAQKQQMALQASYAKKASSGGGGGGSGSGLSSIQGSDSSIAALQKALEAYNAAKQPASSNLGIYYSNPVIQQAQKTGSPAFKNPVPPAQSPYLTDYDKMKMLFG